MSGTEPQRRRQRRPAGGISGEHKNNNDADGNEQRQPLHRRRHRRSRGGKSKPQADADHEQTKQDSINKKNAAQVHPKINGGDAAAAAQVSTHLSETTFASLGGRVDARLLAAIPFPQMSEIQARTLAPALSGNDVLAQAKTGTGKTVAFLLPSLHTLLSNESGNTGIRCLVLSPTRELAQQIEREARMLLRNVPRNTLDVQCVVGGTNIKAERTRLLGRNNDGNGNAQRCDVLVATPGRLLDHLQTTPGFAARFDALQIYILDEADRMLDMGFRNELQRIGQFLPTREQKLRQTLLFSATVPEAVRQVAALRRDAHFVRASDVVNGEENTSTSSNELTHAHVVQTSIVAEDASDLLPLTLALLQEEVALQGARAKVVAFLPTARAAGLAAELFRHIPSSNSSASSSLQQYLGKLQVLEVHSRKSQAQRTRATADFSAASSAVLFSSDVAARGVDFPGVTAVFQIGLPASGEQYVHRIGRTGRAGAAGRGVIVLAPFEAYFLTKPEMAKLPLSPHKQFTMNQMEECRQVVHQTMETKVNDEVKSQAYAAALGYYKSELRSLRWTPAKLVENMNWYAEAALRYNVGRSPYIAPPMLAKTVGKMGLKGVPGLNVVKDQRVKAVPKPRASN